MANSSANFWKFMESFLQNSFDLWLVISMDREDVNTEGQL